MATYWVRTTPLSREHERSQSRIDQLREGLERVGARDIQVGNEVTLEIDAEDSASAMASVDQVLFALGWPSVLAVTQTS